MATPIMVGISRLSQLYFTTGDNHLDARYCRNKTYYLKRRISDAKKQQYL
jgi:hypothetical protein